MGYTLVLVSKNIGRGKGGNLLQLDKKQKMIIMGSILGVILIAAGVVIWMTMGRGTSNQSATTTQVPPVSTMPPTSAPPSQQNVPVAAPPLTRNPVTAPKPTVTNIRPVISNSATTLTGSAQPAKGLRLVDPFVGGPGRPPIQPTGGGIDGKLVPKPPVIIPILSVPPVNTDPANNTGGAITPRQMNSEIQNGAGADEFCKVTTMRHLVAQGNSGWLSRDEMGSIIANFPTGNEVKTLTIGLVEDGFRVQGIEKNRVCLLELASGRMCELPLQGNKNYQTSSRKVSYADAGNQIQW